MSLSLLFGTRLTGQDHHYIYNTLTTKEGLSTSDNAFVYKDSKDLVWISSTDGLNCFDSEDIKVYRPDDLVPHSMLGENIQSNFFEDASTNIWFSTWNGINCYVRKSDNFRTYTLKDQFNKIISEDYQLVDLLSDEKILVTVKGVLYEYNVRTQKQDSICSLTGFRFEHFKSKDTIKYAAHPLGQDVGIEILDKSDESRYVLRMYFDGQGKNQPKLSVTGIQFQNGNVLWLASDRGLVLFNLKDNTFQMYPLPQQVRPNDLAFINQNELLISTRTNGLFVFDFKQKKFTDHLLPNKNEALGLKNQRIDELYLDKDSVLWLSQWTFGVQFTYLRQRKVNNIFLQNPRLSDKKTFVVSSVMSPYNNQEGYFLTNNRLLNLLDFKSRSQRILSNEPHDLKKLYTHNGSLYGLGYHFLYQFKNGKFIRLNQIPFDFEANHLVNWKGKWLISSFDGIYTFDDGKTKRFQTSENVQMVDFIGKDALGNLYINNNFNDLLIKGVDGRERNLKNVGLISGMDSDQITNKSWVATSKGLLSIDCKTFDSTILNSKDGLKSAYVHNVFYVNNKLWFGTNSGVYIMDKSNHTLSRLTQKDGLADEEFFMHSSCNIGDGSLCFVNSTALNIINTHTFDKTTHICPKVHFKNVFLNDDESNKIINPESDQNTSFTYENNTITFKFNALNYTNPSSSKLRYILSGHDKEWIELKQENDGFARYSNLNAGLYHFKVQAGINQDWCETSASYTFRILPPWYKSWWFLITLFVVLSSFGYYMYRLRITRLKREYYLKNEIAYLQRAALQAQMNPHFIFNCLNSIQNFILKNDRIEAMEYLNLFAHLIRQNLNASNQKLLSLDEEIDMLNNYLALEKIRFKNNFDFEIQIDPNIQPDMVYLPPLLIQPFVENAVLHGIADSNRHGQIVVKIHVEHNDLKITIIDNGSGIKATQAPKDHKSLGISITQKRLAFLNNNPSSQYNISTISDQSGTSVTITLRLNS
ncbi:MAG TPA: histidine kinase [Saprospiraceae bacterium]|nr:histidine kinase [Saprospiraceae bacterium]